MARPRASFQARQPPFPAPIPPPPWQAYNNSAMYPYWGHAWSAHSWLGALTLAVWGLQVPLAPPGKPPPDPSLCSHPGTPPRLPRQLFLGAANHVARRAAPAAAGGIYIDGDGDGATAKGDASASPTGRAAGATGARAVLPTLHVVLGHCVFALGLAACATGFVDRQSSDLGVADAVYQLAPASMATDDPAVAAILRSDGRTDDFVYAGRPGNPSLVDGVVAYKPHSASAQLACVAALLLLALGAATNAALRFLPKVIFPFYRGAIGPPGWGACTFFQGR